MCRHLAYVGPAATLGEFLCDAPHALVRQGCAPREMVVAKNNPDGWGTAWWTSPRLEPLHYRSTTPMWEDRAFDRAGDRTTALVAAVRKASPSTTLESVNNAPFVAMTRLGAVAFSLNGHAFHPSCADRVRDAVPADATLVGDTDSEALFAIVRDRIARGGDLADAVADAHHVVDPGPDVYMNLLLGTPTTIVATTWRHSLYVRPTGTATTVTSEALDDGPEWTRVPDRHLLVATATSLTVDPLEHRS